MPVDLKMGASEGMAAVSRAGIVYAGVSGERIRLT
jgi:hypothetical protein